MVTEGIGGDMGLKVRQLRDEVRRYCKSWLGGFAPDDLPALKKPLQETHGDIDSRATSTNIPLTKLRYSDNLWKPWSICFDVLPLLTMVISEGTRLHTHTYIYIYIYLMSVLHEQSTTSGDLLPRVLTPGCWEWPEHGNRHWN
jgi:hypothetical protein